MLPLLKRKADDRAFRLYCSRRDIVNRLEHQIDIITHDLNKSQEKIKSLKNLF